MRGLTPGCGDLRRTRVATAVYSARASGSTGSRTATFLGSAAVDQEYTRTNAEGVARRLLIRLWFHAGHTLEIELEAPATEFAQRRAMFGQLIAGCQVS